MLLGNSAKVRTDRGLSIHEIRSTARNVNHPLATLLAGPTDEKPHSPCEFCQAGRYSGGGSKDCDGCSPGFSSSGINSSGEPVPDGDSTMVTGPRDCEECVAGKYASLVTNYLCEDCEAGKYSDLGSSMCERCGLGKYSGIGQAECTNCEAGKYNNDFAQSECTQCAIAKYQNEPGKTICETCEKGKVTDTSTSSDLGAASCKDCLAMTYKNNKCTSDGSYPADESCTDDDAGQTSLNTCLACPSSKYSGEGAEICQSCPAGTRSFANGAGVTECRACPAGKRSGIKEDECTDCPSGYYSSENMNTELDYSTAALPEKVNDSCDKCSAGKHTSTPEIQKITTTAAASSKLGGSFTFTYTAADSTTVGPVTVNFDSKALDVQESFVAASSWKLEEGDILVKRGERIVEKQSGVTHHS